MRKKLKPDFDPEEIQEYLIEDVCYEYQRGKTIRKIAKEMELSAIKVRKILITGGVFTSDLSTQIDALYKDGKKPSEIAAILNTTTANVNSYLPYERIIYKMEERSVEADRQQRYRDRKKGLIPPVPEKEKIKVERIRNKTMIFILGQKLRKVLPKEILDDFTDPFGRYIHFDDPFNPPDPDKNIWCAELTTNGRGKDKKLGIVLESANCGFIVVAPMPPVPDLPVVTEDMDWSERGEVEAERRKALKEYRYMLEQTMLATIRKGMIDFKFPKNRVADYTDVIGRFELIKGRPSMPMTRVEEFIEKLEWMPGTEPSEAFRVRSNFTDRKFGHSPLYRMVYLAAAEMLDLTNEEHEKWIDEGLRKPMIGE